MTEAAKKFEEFKENEATILEVMRGENSTRQWEANEIVAKIGIIDRMKISGALRKMVNQSTIYKIRGMPARYALSISDRA